MTDLNLSVGEGVGEVLFFQSNYRILKQKHGACVHVVKELSTANPENAEILKLNDELVFCQQNNFSFSPKVLYQKGKSLFFENIKGLPIGQWITSQKASLNIEKILDLFIEFSEIVEQFHEKDINLGKINKEAVLITDGFEKLAFLDISSLYENSLNEDNQELRSDLKHLGMFFRYLLNQYFNIEDYKDSEDIDRYPEPLNLILRRLTTKNIVDNYASIRGLKKDLTCCTEGLKIDGKMPYFLPARKDIPQTIVLDDFLYGRERTKQLMLKALSSKQVIHLTGNAGMGKSSLLNKYILPSIQRHQTSVFVRSKENSYMTYFEICTQLYSLETLMTEEQVYLEQIFKKAKDISFSQRTFKDEGSESLLSSTKRKKLNLIMASITRYFAYKIIKRMTNTFSKDLL